MYFNKLNHKMAYQLLADSDRDANESNTKKVTRDEFLKNNTEKELLEYFKKNPHICDEITCEYPIHIAVSKNYTKIVKYLVETAEVDCNVVNNDGRTPLHFACGEGLLEVVKYLLRHGKADINIEDKYGVPPIGIAAYSDRTNILSFLLTEYSTNCAIVGSDGSSIFHWASRGCSVETFQFLVNTLTSKNYILPADKEVPFLQDLPDTDVKLGNSKGVNLGYKNKKRKNN